MKKTMRFSFQQETISRIFWSYATVVKPAASPARGFLLLLLFYVNYLCIPMSFVCGMYVCDCGVYILNLVFVEFLWKWESITLVWVLITCLSKPHDSEVISTPLSVCLSLCLSFTLSSLVLFFFFLCSFAKRIFKWWAKKVSVLMTR